jgi:hypothetical protein
MNKTTIQLLEQLNVMQSNHIEVLEQRIEVINKHKQHLNQTISNQAHQLESKHKTIDLMTTRIELEKETTKLNADTIGKLFAAAKKDKEVIKQFKQLINQQGKQIKDLQQDNDNLYFNNYSYETTIKLQKEVNNISK